MPTAAQATLQPQSLIEHLSLRPGFKVGDFGVGGAAFFSIPLSRKVGAQGEVLMFDIKRSALSAALSATQLAGMRNCKAVWSNLEIFEGARGIGQSSLDAGLLINVLNQTRKYQEILHEIHRMLKPGAKLLIVEWQPGAKALLSPPAEDRISMERIAEIAKSIGYAPLENFAASPAHWGFVLGKT